MLCSLTVSMTTDSIYHFYSKKEIKKLNRLRHVATKKSLPKVNTNQARRVEFW